MSYNQFVNTIEESLDDHIGIIVIDLSNNLLSKVLLEKSGKLTNLESFVVSTINLIGVLHPSWRAYKIFTLLTSPSITSLVPFLLIGSSRT